MKRLSLFIVLALFIPSLAWADGTLTPAAGGGVQITAPLPAGTNVIGSMLPCVAHAAAPTVAEGAPVPCWVDLSSITQVNLATLLKCEDETNHLCMVSGGAVRQTVVNSAPITGNATSLTNTIYTGNKNVIGQLVCNAGSSTDCGITFALYGNWQNTTTGGHFVCMVTIPTGAATTNGICPEFTQNWSFYYVTTTGVAGTSPVLNIYAMY